MPSTCFPHLPKPEIRDEVFQLSHKQASRRDDNRLRPPKLKPRHYHHDSNFNRSHSSASTSNAAHAISFRGDRDGSAHTPDVLSLSASYDCSANETYFEQCFTRLAKIGEGSFGEVFKVRSKEDGLLYAVKMSKQLFRSEHYRQERLEEVRRYEQFSGHANFVQFYRAWEQDDRLYMQMELCGESLERYLERRQHIPEEKIWSILLDLLLALKSLHDRNLIHLDIKLDNVLISDDDSCKLADFGLVIDVDRANRHQATEGDSRYIAPEIMQGKFSKAADIFSLGIAMLELSCYLELPPNGPLWQQLRSGALPENFIKNISVELQAILKEMMSPNPQVRPTVDELLSHKKFINILQRRSRWDFIKKIKQNIRRSHRAVWSKLCNFKNIIFGLLTSFLAAFKWRKPESVVDPPKILKNVVLNGKNIPLNIVSSTPTTCISNLNGEIPLEFHIDDNYLELTQQGTPTNFAADMKIFNSTPLNHNHSFRSRKDLTKTSFQAVENGVSEPTEDILNGERPNSFLSLDEVETNSQSFTRKPLDTSSILKKRLFAPDDDNSD